MEGIVMGFKLKRPVHYLARSDAFTSPFAAWLLGLLKVIPIYRQQEGPDNLSKNEEVFARCYEILARGGAILIFPEGLSLIEKRLRPLKKGVARLSFGAEQSRQWQLDLQVVPAGFTYSEAQRSFSELLVAFGPPIPVRDLKGEYTDNPAKAINKFNETLAAELRKLIVEIHNPAQDLLAELLFRIYRNEETDKWNPHDPERLRQQQALASRLREIPATVLAELQETAVQYTDLLRECRLADSHFPKGTASPTFELLIGAPLFLVSAFFAFPPFFVAGQITASKVKDPEFLAPVHLVLGLLLYLLWVAIIGIMSFYVSWPLGVTAILFSLSGLYFPRYRRIFRLASARSRYAILLKKQPEVVATLTEQRNQLKQFILKTLAKD